MKTMKTKWAKAGTMFLAAAAVLSSCSNEEVIPGGETPVGERDAVKTSFSFAIPSPVSRATGDDVQGNNNFLGIESLRLMPFSNLSGDYVGASSALAGDPVSAFGGVLITNGVIDKAAAEEINKIFFEVIIAPDYDVDALEILGQKKNRIILVRKEAKLPKKQFRALLNGVLVQDKDMNIETVADLRTVTDKAPTPEEVEDLLFANKIVKNSKSNAIVLAKGKQLLASGVGQTSRVDALKQAIEKAKSFGFDLNGAVMASDAFFPFPDCVEIADKEGITAVIQPGGSVKDDLTFAYCNEHGMAMVTTGIRHFKH